MANKIEGIVESVSANGDLITNISSGDVNGVAGDPSVTVSFGGHQTLGIHASDHQEPESTLIAIMGSSGFLEIGIVGMSLCELLGISVGEAVSIEW